MTVTIQPLLNKEEREKIEKREQRKECCKRALKFSLSQLGLILVIILYAIAGGFIFQHLEATNEKEQCMQGREKYLPMENDTVYKIWTISSSFRSADDSPFAMDAYRKQLSKFRDDILSLGYNGDNCTAMGEPDGPPYQWSYPGSLLFATTIFTTVGYGNIAPKTFWGRLVCIAYAVLGIPLMLLVLANIGEIMADIFRFVYINVCCCGFLQKKMKQSQHQQQQQQQQQQHKQHGPTTQAANRQAPMEAWKDQYNAQKTGPPPPQPAVVDDDDDDDEEDEEEKISVPLTVTLGLVATYIFVGALLFGVWSQLDWLAAAYFCFITIATIGFGDIVPGTQCLSTVSGKLQLVGTAVYMVFGMAILSMAFNLIQDEIVAKFRWLGQKLGIVKPDDDKDEDSARYPSSRDPNNAQQSMPSAQHAPQIIRGPQGQPIPRAQCPNQGPWMDQNLMKQAPPPTYPQLKMPASNDLAGGPGKPLQPQSYPTRYMP